MILLLLIIISTPRNIIKNNIKICICAIAKKENLYVREFVEHYKKLGYNNIFIYDNNKKFDENIKDVIKDYIDIGFVRIIEFRETDTNITPQFKAYKDCYSNNNKFYDWLSFFDIDEFLEINSKYNSIQDFLNDNIFKKCKNIKINWLWYFDKNILYYENEPLQKRIAKFVIDDYLNSHIKSTVRGNLYKNYWEKLGNPHTSELNFLSCSSSGKKIKYNSPYIFPPDYTNAILKHYSKKSFEEYCIKLKRGRADVKNDTKYQFINNSYQNLILKNKYNSEKLKIINRIFNHSKNNYTDLNKK